MTTTDLRPLHEILDADATEMLRAICMSDKYLPARVLPENYWGDNTVAAASNAEYDARRMKVRRAAIAQMHDWYEEMGRADGIADLGNDWMSASGHAVLVRCHRYDCLRRQIFGASVRSDYDIPEGSELDPADTIHAQFLALNADIGAGGARHLFHVVANGEVR